MHLKTYINIYLCLFLGIACKQKAKQNVEPLVNNTKKRAILYAAEKKYALAVESIDSAILLEPNSLELHNSKFNILLRSKQYEKGLTVLDQMHLLSSNNAEAYSFQGYINEKFGKHEQAQRYYKSAVNACKLRAANNVEIFKNKVNIAFLKYFIAGKTESVRYIDSLIMRHPGNGFIQDQKDFIEDFDKEKFIEAL